MNLKDFSVGVLVGLVLGFWPSMTGPAKKPPELDKREVALEDSLRYYRSALDSLSKADTVAVPSVVVVVDTVHVRDTVVKTTVTDSVSFYRQAYPRLYFNYTLMKRKNVILQKQNDFLRQRLNYWQTYFQNQEALLTYYERQATLWKRVALVAFIGGFILGKL